MKILVIHGDNTVKSYDKYRSVVESSKGKGWEIKSLAESDDFNISENLVSVSLFAEKVLYCLDDFNKLKKRDFDWLKKNNAILEGFFLIYKNGVITKTALKKLPKEANIEEFALPKLIWKFLDSIYPKNAKVYYNLLKQVTQTEPYELVFHLIARHLRDLYMVKLEPSPTGRKSSGTSAYPSWRISKLKRQSSKFKAGKLEKLIRDLAEADKKVKRSKEKLSNLLAFVLVSNLE